MRNVTDRTSNPFGMRPPCDRFVPGYGDANADFHVIGDHPGVHGGDRPRPEPDGSGLDSTVGGASPAADATSSREAGVSPTEDADGVASDGPAGVPFTNAAGLRLQRTLVEAGLLREAGDPPVVERTFLSYLHTCVPDGSPTEADYADMERFFDAELRAIAAHVLLPVGERAIRHVVENYTARSLDGIDPETLHATEIRSGGWLVLPVKEPATWTDDDRECLVEALVRLQSTDFRRETDLGRFVPGGDPYYVR